MNCRHARAKLQPYLDGALREAAARAVTAHLARCANCSREFLSLQAVDRALAAEPRVIPPPHLRAAILARAGRRRLRTVPIWLDVLTFAGAGATACVLAVLARGVLIGLGLPAPEVTSAVTVISGAGIMGLGALYFRA